MGFHSMNIRLNKDKSIGKVLYIVEGGKTEPYILHHIFCRILDYQMESFLRDKGYRKFNSKTNATSQIFVINAEESNIKHIAKNNDFLNNLFAELIEKYDFDVDNAAIYYIFDRDSHSNTDADFIKNLLLTLGNSRDNDEFNRQGMLLLSYPSIEGFTLSNFEKDSFEKKFETGHALKRYLNSQNINQSRISEETIKEATYEMLSAFDKMNVSEFDVDDFSKCNADIFDYEEKGFFKEHLYRVLSLLCVSLIDLGILEIE